MDGDGVPKPSIAPALGVAAVPHNVQAVRGFAAFLAGLGQKLLLDMIQGTNNFRHNPRLRWMQVSLKTTCVLICTAIWVVGAYGLVQRPANGADQPAPDESRVEVEPTDSAPRSTNLPLPRFVSLRTDPINMRTGPGVRYPVDWVYGRRGLPVEVVAEFDTWRRINDPDGADGWIHTSMLSARRTAVVSGGLRPIRRTSEDEGELLARLEPGVVVSIQRCPAGSYCRVEAAGVQGWVRRDHLWGVYADEVIE